MNHVQRVDNEISNFMNSSRKFRGSSRNGLILLVGPEEKMCNIIDVIRDSANLQTLSVLTTSDARKTIVGRDPGSIRVAIICSSIINWQANGDSLPWWLETNHPEIPVWVANCDNRNAQLMKQKLSGRVGVLPHGRPEEVLSLVGIAG